ncbi:NEQ529 [Nanoarchaeum equitans Kin4-M]|uniref:NEQ529 n=1 Tax=Nanoarchaeum equitans (strain Kin4-M) TaxID=228908 RepID=Q74M36_NANEQ|nr:NEQ529 [Nanoarchaeum equitans Kin4-M]
MNRKDHFLLTLPWAYIFFRLKYTKIQAIILAILCAYLTFLPDLDLVLGIKHRTITHSLLIVLLFFILYYLTKFFFFEVLALAFLFHIIEDSFTSMGIKLYPLNYRIRLGKTGYWINVASIISLLLFIWLALNY